MPRRRRRAGNRRARRGSGFGRGSTFNQDTGVVRQKFCYHARFASSSSVLTVKVDPIDSPSLFGVDVAQMAAVFQEFRCVGIKITQYPAQATSSATGNEETGQAIGWRSLTSAIAPNSVDDVLASEKSSYCTDHLTVPVVFSISRRDFARTNMLKWYHQVISGGPDTTEQGAIYHVAVGTNASTAIWTWIVQSEWEFRGFTQLNQYLRKGLLPQPFKNRDCDRPPSSDPDEKEVKVPDPVPFEEVCIVDDYSSLCSPPQTAVVSRRASTVTGVPRQGIKKVVASPSFPPG